jgi:hypothetical protein
MMKIVTQKMLQGQGLDNFLTRAIPNRELSASGCDPLSGAMQQRHHRLGRPIRGMHPVAIWTSQ